VCTPSVVFAWDTLYEDATRFAFPRRHVPLTRLHGRGFVRENQAPYFVTVTSPLRGGASWGVTGVLCWRCTGVL
jgi:hypothetical protein